MPTTTKARKTNKAKKGTNKRQSTTKAPEVRRNDAYSKITDRIVELLEQGVVPWRKPWKVGFYNIAGQTRKVVAANLKSKKAYRGINSWVLPAMGYSSPWWVTYKQAQELGGKVRTGEKGTVVVFWKPTYYDGEDDDGKPKKVRSMLLKFYYVWNIEQVDGIPEDKIPQPEKPKPVKKPSASKVKKNRRIKAAEAIVKGFENAPDWNENGVDRAYYNSREDVVRIPKLENFVSSEEYYGTLFHEFAHSTGHPKRLSRFTEEGGTDHIFGSESYSEEELTAEMSAAYLCNEAGIAQTTIENSASYIQSWLRKLKDDRKFVVLAAARAQRASDYILGVKYNTKEEGE